MNELQKRTWAEIHLDHIAHNVQAMREKLPASCRFLGVVKANAYGHGAIRVAKKLEEIGCEYLAVACIDEAIELREAGVRAPILILGYTPPEYAADLSHYEITQAVGSLEMARGLSQNAGDAPVRVHLKLETGMGRTGFRVLNTQELAEAAETLQLPGLDAEGVFTHFCVSDEYGDPFTQEQYSRFTNAISALEAGRGKRFAIRHCANSGAVINYPQYSMDMVRPGIATYGLYPAKEHGGIELLPGMSLRTCIAQITSHEAGDTISYGRKFMAKGPMRIAVLPIGYADGLHRTLSGQLEVLIRGKRCPQLGRICMDMCMVDVSDLPDVRPGEIATIFGRDGDAEISVDELAEKADTISYELLCAVSPRVPRIWSE